jgi:hypothetical protein
MSSSDVSSHWPEHQQEGAGFAAAPVALVVTVAALYGAGGSVVGPRVAERLGVPFLDRGILAGVAEQMRVPVEAVAAYDAQTPKEPRSGIRRYFESLAGSSVPMGRRCRTRMLRRAGTGRRPRSSSSGRPQGAAWLGRGGAVVLRSVPGVLHVRLDGPREARVRQAMRLERIESAGRRAAP